MTAAFAAILVLFAVLLADPGARRGLARLQGPAESGMSEVGASGSGRAASGAHPVAVAGGGARTNMSGRLPALAAAVLAGAGAAVLLGAPLGWLAGPVLGALGFRVVRTAEPAAVRARRRRMEEDLPMTIDVFAACLSAGAAPERALDAIAAADHGPLGRRWAMVAEHLRNGADPRDAWSAVPPEPHVAGLGFFERAMMRAADSGIPLVAALDRLADDVRAERRAAADRRARSVGVRAAAPLGLCFLPAFVLVGIVPMVASALRGLA